MAVADHVRLPDGRRLDLRVSGPLAGFRWCFTTGRRVLPPRSGCGNEQCMRAGSAWSRRPGLGMGTPPPSRAAASWTWRLTPPLFWRQSALTAA